MNAGLLLVFFFFFCLFSLSIYESRDKEQPEWNGLCRMEKPFRVLVNMWVSVFSMNSVINVQCYFEIRSMFHRFLAPLAAVNEQWNCGVRWWSRYLNTISSSFFFFSFKNVFFSRAQVLISSIAFEIDLIKLINIFPPLKSRMAFRLRRVLINIRWNRFYDILPV